MPCFTRPAVASATFPSGSNMCCEDGAVNSSTRLSLTQVCYGSFASILPCPLSRPQSPTPKIATSDRGRVLVALCSRHSCCVLVLDLRRHVPKNRVGLEAQDRRCLAPIAYSEVARPKGFEPQPATE